MTKTREYVKWIASRLANQRLLFFAYRLTGKVYAKLFEDFAVNFAE